MFWDKFYQLCQESGKKPNPVGKEIGVSSATITKWKNGTIPNSKAIAKVAQYFNVPMDYLLDETNAVQEKNTSKIEHITFLERLKSLCKQKDLNLSILVEDLKLNSNSIKNWEKGILPNVEILIKLADYFYCSVDYLLGRTDNPTDNQVTQIIERILLLLKVNKFTAKKLTDDLQLPNGAISEWKKGKSEPSPEELQKIADYFRQPLEWLLTGKGNEAMPKMEGHSYIYIGGIDGTHEFIPVPEEKMKQFRQIIDAMRPDWEEKKED